VACLTPMRWGSRAICHDNGARNAFWQRYTFQMPVFARDGWHFRGFRKGYRFGGGFDPVSLRISTTCGRPDPLPLACCIRPVITWKAGPGLCGGACAIGNRQSAIGNEASSASPHRQGQTIRPRAFSSLLRGGSHRQRQQSQVAKGGLERSEEYILHFLPTSLFDRGSKRGFCKLCALLRGVRYGQRIALVNCSL